MQSGGDHICDLRRDANGDGKPERLGDYVRIRGTVIAEPSTYETGGWLFWVRDGQCGVLIYGEPETLALGDSVEVRGWLRLTNGNYFFPETGLATLGDLAVENAGTVALGAGSSAEALTVTAAEFSSRPQAYGGNLIAAEELRPAVTAIDENGDTFVMMTCGADSIAVYLDGDTGIAPNPGAPLCYDVTGVAVRMRVPPALGSGPRWCIAPRTQSDVLAAECFSQATATTWGAIKARGSRVRSE